MVSCSPSEKENLNIAKEEIDPVLHSMELLSQPPIMMTRGKPLTPLTPFTGYHQFRVWIPEKQITAEGTSRSSSYCYQVTQTHPFSTVYVQPNRRWPLAISFRPSMTPVAYRLRVLPRFVDTQRADDLIETCSKHLGKISNSLRNRSFIQLLSPLAEYVTNNMECGVVTKQISALYPLDVLGLLKRTKIECKGNDVRASFGDSQSHLLPEVQDLVDCQVNCYNTCFGTHFRGQIKLVCTLEIKTSTDFECPYELVGMQQIGLRSCACPSRDLRGSAPSSYSINPSISSSVIDCSPSSDQRRKGSRKLSLNVDPRSRSRPILRSVQTPRMNLPSESTEITVDGENYYLLALRDPETCKRYRLFRDAEFASLENCGPSRVRRWSRKCDRVVLKLVEKVRQDPITCSQESSGSPESSQCDKATETEPCLWNLEMSNSWSHM